MPIRSNRAYNDPSIGAAFDGLASLFAPPSAQDTAAYANARATSEEAARLSDLYAQAPSLAQDEFDRRAIAVGRYNPSQSYHAVGVADSTNRRGQDLESADRRFGTEQQTLASMYGANQTFAASTQNNMRDNERALATNAADNSRQITTAMLDPVQQGATRFVPTALAEMYGVDPRQDGQTAPLSETQWQATQNERLLGSGLLTDNDLVDAVMGQRAPVQVVGPNGPQYATPGHAAREGLTPYEAAGDASAPDNYIALDAEGNQVPVLARVGADGRIVTPAGEDVTDRVVRRAGTGGSGMDVEMGPNGEFRLRTGDAAGNTMPRTTMLQQQTQEARRAVAELTPIFDRITAADVGVAGNVNDLLTSYGAQLFPGIARTDVTAMRNQMQATALSLAASLVNDSRLSDADRRAAQDIQVSQGLGESLPAARAKLAQLIVLQAYREKFASNELEGGARLAPIGPQVLGQLVDDGAIQPSVAQVYADTVLGRSSAAPLVGPQGGFEQGMANPIVPMPDAPRPPAAPTAPAPPAPPGSTGPARRVRFDANGNIVQ